MEGTLVKACQARKIISILSKDTLFICKDKGDGEQDAR